MTLRLKVTLGLLVLLLLLIGTGGYGLWMIRHLDLGSRDILKANFYSVELGQAMLRDLDHLQRPPAPAAVADFRRRLTAEAGNITEPGERELVDTLTATFDRFQAQPVPDSATFAQLRGLTHRMIALNVAALTRKNEHANHTAQRATALLSGALAGAVLLALMLVWSVPAAAVAPLQLLQTAIRHATDHDFQQSIPVESRDEFGAVARDFNRLLAQLQEFRKASLADLLTERNRIASVINTLDEGLLLLDQRRRVLLVNPVAAALLGARPDDLIGEALETLGPRYPLLRDVIGALRPSAASEPQLLTVAASAAEPPAYYRVFTHEIVAFNPARDQLEFTGYVVALRNVSEFKQLDQVKSNFLATAAHELKTPLASIQLSLKLLDDERVAADERHRVIVTTRQETQRLQRLVAELLDVAHLETGNIALAVQPTAVAHIVRFAAQTLEPQLRDKHLRLESSLPPGLPPVLADTEKTSWVLLNLLVNAIRYSPAGQRIQIAADLAEAGAVRISVTDHGPGIAPEHHERIFQRFVRLPDQAADAGGSGLGLSIAREFIGAQGGRLWVESAPGAGSTFRFTLPVAE